MKYTNKHKIPPHILDMLKLNDAPDPDPKVFRATELKSAPLVRSLFRKYYRSELLVTDYSEYIAAMFGDALHDWMFRHHKTLGMAEQRLYAEVDGYIISAQPDLYEDGIVRDLKTTSVAQISKPDTIKGWTEQLNIYSFVLQYFGYPVKGIEVTALLKDWKRARSEVVPSYVKCPSQVIPLTLWPYEKTEEYIKARLLLHNSAPFAECTLEEKWQDPVHYAIMEKGKKRAKVLNYKSKLILTRKKAKKIIKEKGLTDQFKVGTIYLDKREGDGPLKCKSYCTVRSVCPFWKGHCETLQ